VTTVFVAMSAAGIAYTLAQTPRYVATALLSINPNPDQIVPEKQLTGTRIDATAVDSEIEALKAPTLAARLAAELDLDKDAEWNPAFKQEPRPIFAAQAEARATVSAQQTNYAKPVLGFDGDVTDAGGTTFAETAMTGTPDIRPVSDEVVTSVADALQVRRRGLSNVVEISAESASPTRAAEMANGLSS